MMGKQAAKSEERPLHAFWGKKNDSRIHQLPRTHLWLSDLHFLPDLSDPYFRQDAAQKIEQDERMTYCCYMAA